MSRYRTAPIPDLNPLPEYPPSEFIDTDVDYDDTYESTNAEVYQEYCKAAQRVGRAPVSHRRLSIALRAAGFRQSASRKHGRVWPCLYLVNAPISE